MMRLPIFSLGTFHIAGLVIVLVGVAHLSGTLAGALSGLSTLAGFVLFLALWALSLWSTGRALRGGVDWRRLKLQLPATVLLYRGFVWGGVSGALFFPWLLAILTITTPASVGVFLIFSPVALIAAYVIGAVVGVTFATVDSLLFAATSSIATVAISRSA